jgi:beta-N-acetylhexosaminidase
MERLRRMHLIIADIKARKESNLKGFPLVGFGKIILVALIAWAIPAVAQDPAEPESASPPAATKAESKGETKSDIESDLDNVIKSDSKAEAKPETKAAGKAAGEKALLDKLTLPQKIGQLMILGFSGTQYRQSLAKMMPKLQPGAVIIFSRNIKSMPQIAELNREAQVYSQKLTGLPLFVMVDQEGGAVARIKTKPPLPSALALGETKDPELVKEVGRLVGDLMNTLGFNFNLAPVLDIGNPKRKSFIGNRAFGGDPQAVSDMAMAFSMGLADAKVVPTAKHFPGHGGLVQDSHKKTPNKLLSYDELEKGDLVPFKQFIGMNVPSAVMVAHVAFPHIDESGLPAAFSPILITDILRGKLAYDGLVITDDIEMQGAEFAGSVGERAIKAIEAGCDMVMVAWSPKRQWAALKAIHAAVKSGRITEERINASVLRVIRAKMKLALGAPATAPAGPADLKAKLETHLGSLREVTRKVHRQNFQKSAKSLSTDSGFPPDQPFVIFSSDGNFYAQFKRTALGPARFVPLTPKSINKIEAELAASPDAVGVFYATGSVTTRKLNSLSRDFQRRMIVVNATYPGAVENPENYRAVLQMNSLEPESGFWLAEAIFPKPNLKAVEELPEEGEREPSADSAAPDSGNPKEGTKKTGGGEPPQSRKPAKRPRPSA